MDPIVSVNPATLATIGEFASTSAAEVGAAVLRARAAQESWGRQDIMARARVIRAFGRLLHARREEVAALVTEEVGKPLPEALLADVLPVQDAVEWLVEEGTGVLARGEERFRLTRPILTLDRTSRIMREPLGVIGIIAPWNYPFAIPGTEILYALLAGNAVVLKPSEHATATAARLVQMLHEAGVPEDLVILVPGPGSVTGAALAQADIDHLVFTGSVATGRVVEDEVRPRGIHVTLELGGSDPAIVRADADLDLAANGILWGRFANAGQTCAAVKRVYVHESVHDALLDRLVEKGRALRVGNGAAGDVDVGPLIRAEAVEEMEGFVADAKKHGGTVVLGGERVRDSARAGHFFAPTIIRDATPGMRLMREECFGPVLPVMAVPDDATAVAQANATPFGLSASIWTADTRIGESLARRIRAGTVTVNDCLYTYGINSTPWRGVKASGTGVTHGKWGLLELTRMKHVNVAPAKRVWSNLWWFPYGPGQMDAARAGTGFLFGGLGGKLRNLAVVRALLGKRNL